MKNFTESMLLSTKPLRLYLAVLFSALMLYLPEAYANPPMPANTEKDIHAAQIFNYNISNLNTETGVADYVWGSKSPLPFLVYNTYYLPFDREYDTSHDLTWYLQNHPDWIVYKSDGTPAWEFGHTEYVPIDISNSAVRDYIFNTLCVNGIRQGYKGLAFDNVSLLNTNGRYGIKINNVLTQKYTGNTVDAAYKTDVLTWAADMYSRIHGINATVTMNYSYKWADGTVLINYMDILMDEQGFTNGAGNPYVDANWLTNMQYLQYLETQGKGLVSINECHESFANLTLAHKQWILANFLLIKGSHHYVSINGPQEYGSLMILPEYSARIGTALGSMYSYGNVYMRDFSGGKALVNPSSTKTYTIGLPGGAYEDLYGNMMNSVTLSPASGIVLLNAPAAWWKLDETSGTVAADSSIYKHNGTLVNGPTWTPAGETGGGLNFDGSNDYVTASNLAVNAVAGGANTVTFWMKWNGGDSQMPFAWGGNHYNLCLLGGNFGINTGNNDVLGIPFTSANYANKWVHVAVVFPNGAPGVNNAKMYINGMPQPLTQIQGTPAGKNASSYVFLSGWDTSSQFKFGGTIDDVRIYDRELPADVVKSLAGMPVIYLKLDETSGTVAADSSIYGHNGTLVNGPAWTTSGRVAGGLNFDGSNDYVTASNLAVNTVAGGVNTVTFWMKWNGANNQMPFAWTGNYDVYISGGSFGINTGNGDLLGIPFTTTNYANKWVHVAVVFPNGAPGVNNAKMYINGVQQTLTQIRGTSASKNASSNVFLSGWDTSNQYKFGGTLDEVRIYNYELSTDDVKSLAGMPVIYLKLDETSGTVAADSSGCGHNATLVNGPKWTTGGKVAGALSFDGINDYATASNLAVNTVAGGVNTVTFWMKWNGASNQMPFAWGGNHYNLYLLGGNFGINTGNNDVLGIPFATTNYANKWVHVAVVFPNGAPGVSNAKMYINGVQQTLTQRGTPVSKNASSNVFLSGWDTSNQFKFGGTIDEVRIFDRELSADDVTSLYNGTY